MVHYNLDTDSRSKTYGLLGVSSAALASLATLLFNAVPLPVAAPSGLVIFGALFALLDRFAWRWPGINALLGIPDLDGYWEGTLERHLPDGSPPERRTVKLTITQRWTTMSIVFAGQSSRSNASVISLTISDPKQISMRWVYDAHDTSGQPHKNRYGEGATRLALGDERGKRKLSGMYYSTKLSSGKLTLTEVSHG